MKLHTIVKLLILGLSLSCFSCDLTIDGPNNHYHIPFTNNSADSIYAIWYGKYSHLMGDYFRDTLLWSYYYAPSYDPFVYKIGPGEENKGAISCLRAFEEVLPYEIDTLLVFVFNADTLDIYGWDTVCTYYKVEQRYDLSLEELQNLDFKLSFPPTEAMKHIHMWPPYGTYDEHGRRKDTK